MFGLTAVRVILASMASIAGSAAIAAGQAPKPFELPRDRVAWEARRASIRADLEAIWSRGVRPRPDSSRLVGTGREERGHVVVERFTIDGGSIGAENISGSLVLPAATGSTQKIPLILLVTPDAISQDGELGGRGLDGRPPAVGLARFGYASLILHQGKGGPGTRADADPARLVRDFRVALDAASARPEFDPDRIGVIGLGEGGLTALGLMALDERIDCGVAAIESNDVGTGLKAGEGRGSTRIESRNSPPSAPPGRSGSSSASPSRSATARPARSSSVPSREPTRSTGPRAWAG